MSAEVRMLKDIWGDRYELLSCIAIGGMGEVWKARDCQLQRYVAIKLLRPDRQDVTGFMARFTQEARVLASLSHPNIVKIHNFYSENNPPLCYIVMDYIEGPTLAAYIRSTSYAGHPPPPADLLYIFASVGRALDYAHRHGLIHRDIKPANILLDRHIPAGHALGHPVLADFGIARSEGLPGVTVVGSVIGTPTYIAPEQAQGRPTEPRSDLYSLGVILYEMLVGRPPFCGDSAMAVMMQHIHDLPPPPESLNPRITSALSRVILKSIAKDPADRFPTAAVLVQDLAQGLEVSAPISLAATPSLPVTVQFSDVRQRQVTSEKLVQEHPQTAKRVAIPKKLLLLIAALIMLLIDSLLGTFLLFSRTANDSAHIMGHASFSKTTGDTYSSLRIDIPQIADPPQGKTYYAWIITPDESNNLHWQLLVKQRAIHTPPLSAPGIQNLLIPNSLLLITVEDAETYPVVPDTNLDARLYYGKMPASPVLNLDLRSCPKDAASPVCI